MPETSPTLQEDCIRSAEIYLKYLEENREGGKGMLRAQVRSVQTTLLDSNLEMLLDREIRGAEMLTLRIGGTVYENTEEQKHYVVQSADRRKITITPSPEVAEHISQATDRKEKIWFEMDLTFLVRRIKEWYEEHGDAAELPWRKPKCRLDPENPIALSDNQYECAEKAMGSPLTYIWGAPGTGKTKHVLASCIYSYIKSGKKVVLVAPTNNALEQSLQGLLPTLSQSGIDPDGKVLRLGFPSEGFKNAWPNVCETGAFQFLKMEIEEQLSRLRYENQMIDESLEVKAGKAEDGVTDLYPEESEQELAARKKKNTARINELLGQNHNLEEKKSITALIDRFSVIAATVDSCIYRLNPGGKYKPDHVFLDEAGYCSVIKGIPLTGFGCPLTMLGDHKQLPPVYDCEDRKLVKDPKTQIVKLWQVSALYLEDAMNDDSRAALCRMEPERPTFSHTTTGALQETHRFGPALAEVLARRVYGKRFCSRSVNETRILYVNAPKKAEDKGQDDYGEYRRISSSERKCIRDIMERNLSRWDYTVGIITPYTKQRNSVAGSIHRLMRKYERTEDMDDDVVTVHRSQGREWDVVLFSVTDSFEEAYFTNSNRADSLKLINTAVSRAKKMLILVGDAADWKTRQGQLISDLFRVAEEMDPEIGLEEYLKSTGTDRETEE